MGISSVPYNAYFPSTPSDADLQDQVLRSSPYAATFAAYDPHAIQRAQEEGEVEGALDNFDPQDPEQITGLQRMIGQGKIKPQQANAIITAARFARPRVAAPSKTDRGLLLKDYSDYTKDISDEDKRAAFRKNAKTDIASDEDWKRAWHMIKDPRQAKFLSDMDAIEKMGGVVPDELQKVRQGLIASVSPTAATAPQSTETKPAAVAQSGDIQTLTSPAEVRKLPPGTPFRTPDGQIRISK